MGENEAQPDFRWECDSRPVDEKEGGLDLTWRYVSGPVDENEGVSDIRWEDVSEPVVENEGVSDFRWEGVSEPVDENEGGSYFRWECDSGGKWGWIWFNMTLCQWSSGWRKGVSDYRWECVDKWMKMRVDQILDDTVSLGYYV